MKYLDIIKSFIILSGILLSLNACTHSHEDHDTHGHGHHSSADSTHGIDTHENEAHAEGEIHLTKAQIKTMNITFGDFSQVKINEYISSTGTLGLPPNAYSSVSAKASGFIKNSKMYIEGSYVKKGVIMAYLENPEFIEYQRSYLEVKAELTYLSQELKRQQALVDANAGVEKNLQKLQSEVNLKTATLKGISKQMAYLGINVANVTPDNIVERIAIISPMAGYITSIVMHNGMYVEPNMELMEIVDEHHLHLELDIFEKDIAKVKEDQKITYTVPALGNEVFDGEVHVIGKEFNTENKTVRIHGHLENKRPKFIKDLFIEAKIWLNDETVQALPEKAIIKDGSSSYIYYANANQDADEVQFEPMMIIPGLTENGFTAVKLVNEPPANMQIVTDGAYYVYAQSMAGELEHNH